MQKMTFEQYKKNRPFFSEPYYVDLVKRVEKQFFSIPEEKIHDVENELPPKLNFGILGESTYLSVPCIVFMSDGTEYGTYCDVADFYCYNEKQWYFDCLPYASQPLYKVYRREPVVLKWVPLKRVEEEETYESVFKYRGNYYEIV